MRKVLYILGELEDSDLQWIADAGASRNLAAGTTIIEEGGENDNLYIVVDGELDVHKAGTHVATLAVGEVVGEMSMLDSRPASATVTARAETQVYVIQRAALAQKLDADSSFAARFYRALCMFLANRLGRTDLMLNANAASVDGPPDGSEMSPEALENVAKAGARFDWFLQRVRGSVPT